MKRLLTAFFLSIAPVALHAQQDTAAIQTDRPDQSESAQLLKPGEVQLEAGAFCNPFRNGSRTAVIGMTLVRVGVWKKLELGLVAEDGRNRDFFLEETTQGVYPLAARAKLELFKKASTGTDAALVTYLKLPGTAREADQNAYWSPAFILAVDQELSKKWMVEFNAGYKQNAYDPEWAWLATAALKWDVTPALEVFGEYFAHYANGESAVNNADAGVSYKLTRNVQVDLACGSSLGAEVANYFVTTGLSFRLPRHS